MEAGFSGAHTAPGTHGIRIEERLTEGTYALRAELPGIDLAKDVEITVTGGVLTLWAERGEETTDKHHTEFRYGTFTRAVRLPAGAKGDEATAEYKDGVLTAAVLAVLILRLRNQLYRRLYEEENIDADADGIPDIYQRTAQAVVEADRKGDTGG
ncbi:Hsp20/alpha crystallin family protein [Streptomyces tauricus]